VLPAAGAVLAACRPCCVCHHATAPTCCCADCFALSCRHSSAGNCNCCAGVSRRSQVSVTRCRYHSRYSCPLQQLLLAPETGPTTDSIPYSCSHVTRSLNGSPARPHDRKPLGPPLTPQHSQQQFSLVPNQASTIGCKPAHTRAAAHQSGCTQPRQGPSCCARRSTPQPAATAASNSWLAVSVGIW
jgi:hypothetical protein